MLYKKKFSRFCDRRKSQLSLRFNLKSLQNEIAFPACVQKIPCGMKQGNLSETQANSMAWADGWKARMPHISKNSLQIPCRQGNWAIPYLTKTRQRKPGRSAGILSLLCSLRYRFTAETPQNCAVLRCNFSHVRDRPDWVAERVGFEPTIRLPAYRISSAAHSTSLPPLRSMGALIGLPAPVEASAPVSPRA